MTAADKFGIAFSIGFTVALIAIALSFGAISTTQAPVVPTPMPPVVKPAPPIVEETTMEEVPEEETAAEEEAPMEEMIMEADVSIPEGTSTPGCEADNACYVPFELTVGTGGTVTWTNDDTASHTVTSGTPTDGQDNVFDSGIIMSGNTFEHNFDEAGEYDYFCIVHPWMTGKVIVE